jgi:hypothetical protein
MVDTKLSIQRLGARMRRFVSLLWAVCLILVVMERFSAAGIRLVTSGLAPAALRHLACEAVAALPEGLFLLGLWWIREALASLSRGEWFAASMTRMLDRVGVVLAWGAAARILVVPGVCRLLGFDSGYWIAFDAASLVLCAIGLALKALAQVLRHASVIQAELDEIF